MRAIYAGSFNPIHTGHLDIIRRAAKSFDEVLVLVCDNSNKTYKVSAYDRQCLIKSAIKSCCLPSNVHYAILPEGMAVGQYAQKEGYDILVRGIRSNADLATEMEIAAVNRTLGIDTVFFPSKNVFSIISSSTIRECVKYNISIGQYLTPGLAEEVEGLYG